jgi:hypothetical protein
MSIKTFAAVALTALTLTTATLATSSPAEARRFGPGFGLAAGLVIGGALAAGAAHAHYGYGYYGPRRVCSVVERFNRWGEYVGTREVCRIVY